MLNSPSSGSLTQKVLKLETILRLLVLLLFLLRLLLLLLLHLFLLPLLLLLVLLILQRFLPDHEAVDYAVAGWPVN